jgi:hypothetical protein
MLRKPKRKTKYASDQEPVPPTNLICFRTTPYFFYYREVDNNDIWIEQVKEIPYCGSGERRHEI